MDYQSLLNKAITDFDSFSLIWRDELEYNDNAKNFEQKLNPFLIQEDRVDEWPGTQLESMSATMKVYALSNESIQCLKKVSGPFEFLSPSYPEDLAFYRKKETVYASSAHEKVDWHF